MTWKTTPDPRKMKIIGISQGWSRLICHEWKANTIVAEVWLLEWPSHFQHLHETMTYHRSHLGKKKPFVFRNKGNSRNWHNLQICNKKVDQMNSPAYLAQMNALSHSWVLKCLFNSCFVLFRSVTRRLKYIVKWHQGTEEYWMKIVWLKVYETTGICTFSHLGHLPHPGIHLHIE